MADDGTQTPPADKTDEGQQTPTPKTFDEDYVKGLRNESAGYRTSLRSAETERDEARKTSTEATEKASAAESRAAAAEATALKYRIALETGVPLELADRLIGSTREEIEKDAKALVALAGKQPTSFDQGRQETPPASQPSPSDALRALARGRR